MRQKNAIEKILERFQNVIQEIAQRMDELKEFLEDTASRSEINDLVSDIILTMQTETAAGAVKCIACGRDIVKVVGSATESEANKILGPPPTSYAFKRGQQTSYSVQYTNREGFDSLIVESPKAIKPIKPIIITANKTKLSQFHT